MEYLAIVLVVWMTNAIILIITGITLSIIVYNNVSNRKNLETLAGIVLLEKVMREKQEIRNQLIDKGKSPITQRDLIVFLPFSMILKVMLLVFSKYGFMVELIAEQERDVEFLRSRLED